MRRLWRALGGLAVAAACAGAAPTTLLILGAPDGGATYFRRVVKAGETLRYRYVHSASGTPVEEEWVVVEGPQALGLAVRSLTYEATGGGLPAGPDVPQATFEATEKGFVVRGLDRPLGLPLDLRVSPEAKNTLVIGQSDPLDLTKFTGPDGRPVSLVRLSLTQ